MQEKNCNNDNTNNNNHTIIATIQDEPPEKHIIQSHVVEKINTSDSISLPPLIKVNEIISSLSKNFSSDFSDNNSIFSLSSSSSSSSSSFLGKRKNLSSSSFSSFKKSMDKKQKKNKKNKNVQEDIEQENEEEQEKRDKVSITNTNKLKEWQNRLSFLAEKTPDDANITQIPLLLTKDELKEKGIQLPIILYCDRLTPAKKRNFTALFAQRRYCVLLHVDTNHMHKRFKPILFMLRKEINTNDPNTHVVNIVSLLINQCKQMKTEQQQQQQQQEQEQNEIRNKMEQTSSNYSLINKKQFLTLLTKNEYIERFASSLSIASRVAKSFSFLAASIYDIWNINNYDFHNENDAKLKEKEKISIKECLDQKYKFHNFFEI